MTTLRLIRHPPVEVAPGVCYGQSDLPCGETSLISAAKQLAPQLPLGCCIWHSPLQRCERLAQQIRRERADISLKADARLLEMHFGAWELRPWDEIGPAAMDEWLSDFLDARPGGALPAESVRELMARVVSAIEDTVAATQQPVVWITHAGVIRAAQAIAERRVIFSAADWPSSTVPFGRLTELTLPNVGELSTPSDFLE